MSTTVLETTPTNPITHGNGFPPPNSADLKVYDKKNLTWDTAAWVSVGRVAAAMHANEGTPWTPSARSSGEGSRLPCAVSSSELQQLAG